jgi:hypothetical protein
MKSKRAHQIEKTINGVLQLCLGQVGGIAWVNQIDAAVFTDGKTIYMPRPTGEHDGEFELLLAIALREVARLTHSSASTFEELSHAGAMPAYADLVEDSRIKRAISSQYLGAPDIFRKAFEIAEELLNKDGLEESVEQLKRRLVYVAANCGLHSLPSNHFTAVEPVVAKTGLPFAVVERAAAMAMTSCSKVSTSEALLLAQDLGAVLDPTDQQQSQGGQGQDQGEGQPDGQSQDETDQQQSQGEQGQDQGGGQPDGQSQDETDQQQSQGGQGQDQGGGQQGGQSQDEADQQQSQGGQGQDQGEGQQDGQSQDEADQQQSQAGQGSADYLSNALAKLRGFDCAKALDPAAKAASELDSFGELTALQSKSLESAMNGEGDFEDVLRVMAEEVVEAGSTEEDDALLAALFESDGGAVGLASAEAVSPNRLPPVPGRLVSVLLRELQDRRHRPSRLASSGPRVDASRMWRLGALGDTKLFRKRAKVHGIDAGVSVILDRSGSMDQEMERAAGVAYAMVVALQRISGVKTSIDVFPGTDSPISEILAFRQNPRQVKSVLESISADGGTPTGQALSTRLKSLLDLRCEKRVIFVITDGQPDSGQMPILSAALRTAVDTDVMVIGIGLGTCPELGRLFKTFITVEDVEQLPAALEALFRTNVMDCLTA